MRTVCPLLATASVLVAMGTAPAAHPDPTAMHTVKYIVTSTIPASADIYYRDAEPPTFADYSHNPYQYSPKAEANIAPGAPWEFEVELANPDRWAMVTVTNGLSPETPVFRCELVVDGVTAAVNEGPKGALCSLRHW